MSQRVDRVYFWYVILCISIYFSVHGEWGQWSNWTECDKPCGVGFQNRSRVCDDPAPQHGGDDCVGTLTNQTQLCNVHYCPGKDHVYNGILLIVIFGLFSIFVYCYTLKPCLTCMWTLCFFKLFSTAIPPCYTKKVMHRWKDNFL